MWHPCSVLRSSSVSGAASLEISPETQWTQTVKKFKTFLQCCEHLVSVFLNPLKRDMKELFAVAFLLPFLKHSFAC